MTLLMVVMIMMMMLLAALDNLPVKMLMATPSVAMERVLLPQMRKPAPTVSPLTPVGSLVEVMVPVYSVLLARTVVSSAGEKVSKAAGQTTARFRIWS